MYTGAKTPGALTESRSDYAVNLQSVRPCSMPVSSSCFARLIIAVLVITISHEREAVPMDAKYLGRTTKPAGPKKATLTIVASEATTGTRAHDIDYDTSHSWL